MKKILLAVLLLVAMIFLASCDSDMTPIIVPDTDKTITGYIMFPEDTIVVNVVHITRYSDSYQVITADQGVDYILHPRNVILVRKPKH